MRDAKASLTGKRSDFCERKNPTLGFLRPQKSDTRIFCVRKNPTLGFLRPQKSDGGRVICVPHGANPSRQGRGTRSELAYAASLTGCLHDPIYIGSCRTTREGRCIRQFRLNLPPRRGGATSEASSLVMELEAFF